MKIRKTCIWHILLGAGLPWLSFECNLGGVIFFCAYEYLQYRYLSKRNEKDDSYLDIKEAVIPYIISSVIRKAVGL